MARQSEERPGSGLARWRLGRRAMLRGAAALGGAAGAAFLSRSAAGPPAPGVSAAPAGAMSQPTEPLQRRVLSTSPLIAEAPVNELEGIITPNRVHFVRSHFNIPQLDAETWSLTVDGAVSNPLIFTLDDLKALPSRTLTCYIECSGNSRSFFQPPASGSRWLNGGISVAEWTGVPLATILNEVGMSPATVDVMAEGADSGRVYSAIPVEKALDPDTLVAYAQNGETLTFENGYPVRLVVPGWGGIRSIKWLAHIEAFERRFQGYYNDRVYVYETPGLPKKPVQALGVKSFITRPGNDSQVPADGTVVVIGYAYSGLGQIVGVELSVGGGDWQPVQILEPVQRWAWVRWQYEWQTPAGGEVTLRSRATDDAGNVQPETVAWNRYGYGYNAIQSVKVQVTA